MKKLSIFFTLVLIILTFGISTVFAVEKKISPIQRNVGGINVEIDPRIELLTAVQILSNYGEKMPGLITREEFSYKKEMIEYFSPYSEHKAVKLFEEMSENEFNHDAPPSTMLYYSQSTDLKLERPVSSYILERAGGEEKLDEFIDALRDFAKESKFDEFYNDHSQFYTYMLDKNVTSLENENYIKEIEDYYGSKNKSYTIILAPITHAGGYGPSLEDEKGKKDIYCILGPYYAEEDIPIFGDKKSYEYIVWHEFSHSFVNPITEKNIDEVNKYDSLFEPISDYMSSLSYPYWEISVNEHLLRAVTARRSYKNDGNQSYTNSVINEKTQGFYYIEALIEDLKEYENNRDKYKNFEEFYPQIINTFKELSSKDLGNDFYTVPFNGSITSASNNGHENVIIIPTAEKDSKTEQEIQEYGKEIEDFLNENRTKKTTLMTDTEALESDLSDKNIFVYGTVEGNLFLKKYCSNLPFEIYSDKIIAGEKTYKGNNLRLIAGYESPLNKACGMVVYTAQRAKDIVGINSVFHGPKSYYIFEEDKEIISGNYLRINNKWSLK